MLSLEQKNYRVIFLALGLTMVFYSMLFQTGFDPGRWMTYRDFDYPEEKNFINYLSPGIKDMSTGTSYDFEHPHKTLLWIILLVFFPLMFALRVLKDTDFKLGVKRYITQWLTFVLARMGIFRVTGVCPIKRSSLGVFPFMNCQSCELATGACPLGTFQMSLLNKQIPFLVIGQTILVGLATGRGVCGWLCPYGFLSDIFDKLPGRRIRIPKWTRHIKYVYLGIFLFSSVAYFFKDHSDSLFYCSFLCPTGFYYGVLEYGLTTGLKDVMNQFPFMHLMLVYHISFALMILIGSMKLGGRFFCKYFCPLGTLYGFFSSIAFLQIRLNGNHCSNCRKCVDSCPMKIDVRDQRALNKSNCILCGRCEKVCPTHKVEWSFHSHQDEKKSPRTKGVKHEKPKKKILHKAG